MDNRFGIKDLFLFVLLVGVIVLIGLAMVQYDRQWQIVRSINDQLVEQTRELAELRRTVQQGVRVAAAADGPTTQRALSPNEGAGGPFKYVKEAQENKDYALGDWLIDNFAVKLGKMTPLVSVDLYADWVASRVQESLAYQDPMTLDYLPLLATGWQISPDGMTFAFQLRRGVTFSDGAPMTADDVVFTFDYIMNPKVAAPRLRAYYDKIKSVQKTGPYEVVFKLKEPYFESFDLVATMSVMPKHYYEKFTAEQFNESTGMLMGTGPYMLRGADTWRPEKPGDPKGFWHPGEPVELVRNERYWGEPGPFNRLVWREVEQESTEMTLFKNGDLDLFACQPEQYKALLADKSLVERTQHFEYYTPTSGYSYVAWNEKRNGKPTVFADKRVRLAMTMLIDRQRMVDELLLGYGNVATGPFYPFGKQNDPSIKPWPYDPAKAKELLKEAGFADRNGDGLLEGPDGQPMRLKLTYASGNKFGERIALFMKDGLAKAGIVMEPDPTDWPIMMKKIDNRDFDAMTLAWGGSIESDLYQEFHSSQIADQGDDFMSYANPDLDKIIEKARSTMEEKPRNELWREAQRILHEDQPYTFLFNRQSLVFLDKRIHNVQRSKIGLNYPERFVIPIPWYVPKSMQKWK